PPRPRPWVFVLAMNGRILSDRCERRERTDLHCHGHDLKVTGHMNRTAHRLLMIWNWGSLAAFVVGCVWLWVLLGGVPRDEVMFVTMVISIPMLLFGAVLVRFHRSQRDLCAVVAVVL